MQERDVSSIPALGRSPGDGHGNPFQYSCLENPMDRGAWQAAVHRVPESQTRLKWLSMHADRVKESQKRYGKHQDLISSSRTRDHIAKFCWIIEKAREFQKNIYCFIDYAKAFDCVDHNELWKALKEMGIQDHLTCLLRNLYVGQEATVRTLYGTTDWFKIEKGIQQGCRLSPCLFNLYPEHIMRNAGLDELQAGIKIGGRNINNLRCADYITLMTESEEALKSLLMRVKEESERASLKLNI